MSKHDRRIILLFSLLGKIFKIIAEISAIVVAALACILGMLNLWDIQTLLSVFAGLFTFTIVYFLTQTRNIKFLREKIDSSISRIEEEINKKENPNCDEVFYKANEPRESEIIKSAVGELFFLQETGALLIEKNKSSILSFLQAGGFLRIIICQSQSVTGNMLALRNSDLSNPASFVKREEIFFEQIHSLFRDFNSTLKQQIEIRRIPYPIAITAVLSSNGDEQHGVVRFAGFKLPYSDKIDIYFDSDFDPHTCSHYFSQWEQYYLHSYKKILITGLPHQGKTTLIKELIRSIPESELSKYVFYVYSEEIIENGNRVGYQYFSSSSKNHIRFATRNKEASYDVDIEKIDTLAEEIANNLNKVLIIDEIGLMQIKSRKFSSIINQIIFSPNTTMIATITKNTFGNTDLSNIKESIYTSCVEFTRENHDSISMNIKKELHASINAYSILEGDINETEL